MKFRPYGRLTRLVTVRDLLRVTPTRSTRRREVAGVSFVPVHIPHLAARDTSIFPRLAMSNNMILEALV